MAMAVRVGNEYLPVRPVKYSGTSVRQVDEETEAVPEDQVKVAQANNQSMFILLQAVQKLAEEVGARQG